MAVHLNSDESTSLIRFLENKKHVGNHQLSNHVLDTLVEKGWLEPSGLSLNPTTAARQYIAHIRREDLL